MKFKLSAALSAALLLSVAIPAVGAVVPGDEGAVSPKMVEEIAGLRDPAARRSPAKAPTTMNKRQFAGQSSRDALRLAAEHDPVLFGPQPTRALQLPPGATVKNYLDDFGARIDIAGQGPDVIASSTTPLRVTRDGVKRAVDLKLVDRGDVIEPLAPVVPLSFPRTLGRGITIGEHIRMRVVGAGPSAEAQLAGQQVFYANALTDADVFATPLPSGLETFVQLRSADSPTTIVYQLDLPAGARLVKQPGEHGGVGIIRDDDDVLATVAAPVSTDANDTLVPTTMRVDGDRLILDVAVTDSTVMPVLVDPVVTDNQFAGSDSASSNGSFGTVSGWRRETSGPFGNFTFSPNSDSSYNGGVCYRVVGGQLVTIANQLCVSTQSSRSYGGEVGQWAWRPPSGIRGSASDGPNIPTDAYIYRAYVRHSYSRFSASGGAYMFAGLRSGRTGAWIGASSDISQSGTSSDYRAGGWTSGAGYNGTIYNGSFLRHYCAATDCSVEHPNEPVYDGTWFSFGLYALGSGHSASANAQGAIFYQYDRTPPTITHTTTSDLSGWKKAGSVSHTVAGTDIGMGMRSVGITYPNQTSDTRTFWCTGTTQSPCQPTYTQTFTTNVDNLPEGLAAIGSTATDVLAKPAATSPAVTVKVDRSAPDIAISGRLAEHDNKSVSEAAYSLRVSATDGVQGGSPSQQRSGVKSIEVLVDGTRAHFVDQPAADSKPLETTYTFRTDDFEHGDHTVQVLATDNLGQTRDLADPINVSVDHDAGELAQFQFEDEQINDRSDLRVNVANGNLIFHQEDVKIAGTGLNLAIDRFYNSRQSQTKSDVGYGWNISTAFGMRMDELAGGSARLFGPSGYVVTFVKKTDGGFQSPRGVSAELKQTSDGAYTLEVDGSREEYRFGSDGRLIRHEDNNDNAIVFARDAAGRVSELTDTQGRVVRLAYNDQGLLASIADPTGRSWRYEYDTAKNLTRYTDPAGGETILAYDAKHRLTKLTDPRGNATDMTYDDPYRRVASITRDGHTTRYAYEQQSSDCDGIQGGTGATIVTDARGNKTTFCHDEHAQVKRVEDALHHRRARDYNSDGNVTSLTSASNSSTTALSFDGRNLSRATSATGAASQFAYGDSANPHAPTLVSDPQGNSLGYKYDPNGNMTSTASRSGACASPDAPPAECELVKLTYNAAGDEDPEGTLQASTDGNDHTTTYDYDEWGNLISEDPPGDEQGIIRYEYDALSRPTAVTDGKGQRRTMSYDTLDRLARVTHADDSSVGFAYDANGNRSQREAPDGTTTYGYDARNQLVEERLPGDQTNAYAYDAVGNLLSITHAGGTVSYLYDEVNLLTQLTEPGGKQTTFRYNADNQRELTVYPNATSQAVTYDRSGRVNIIRGRTGGADGELAVDLDYDYAATGGDSALRQNVKDAIAGDTTTYSYDTLNRLTRARTTDDSSGDVVDDYRYDYDRNSNRLLSQTHNGEQIDYDYNSAGELTGRDKLDDPDQVTYTYDRNGSLTGSSAGLQIAYNAANQTTVITPPGAEQRDLAYAGTSQAERTRKGSINYANNALGLGAEQHADSATYYTRDSDGRLVSLRRNGQSSYYLTDAIGSVLAVTKPDGSIGARYSYEPFGQLEDTSGDLTQPYRFAGEYHDTDTGLYKIGLRYYDPQTGRWTQKDPIVGFADPRRNNRYIYAGQDPINNTDPSGADFLDDVGVVALNSFNILSNAATAGAAGLALTFGTPPCLAAIPGSGPAAPLVATGCGVFVAGNVGVIAYSFKDSVDSARRIGRHVRG